MQCVWLELQGADEQQGWAAQLPSLHPECCRFVLQNAAL